MKNGPASVMPRAVRESAAPPARASSKSLDARVGVGAALAGACILAGVSFVAHRPKATAATAVAPLVGAWHDGGEEWLVLNADGTGARTRPDPTWGSRRYTFRWHAEGDAVSLTDQRVTLSGGSAISAGDSREAFSVTSQGGALVWGERTFLRHQP